MNVLTEGMKITYRQATDTLRERLRPRLEGAAQLRCAAHGQSVVAVTIHGRENGWFDALWTTCCTGLETQAKAIVKDRC